MLIARMAIRSAKPEFVSLMFGLTQLNAVRKAQDTALITKNALLMGRLAEEINLSYHLYFICNNLFFPVVFLNLTSDFNKIIFIQIYIFVSKHNNRNRNLLA